MTTLTIRLGAVSDIKAAFVAAGQRALSGNAVEAVPYISFSSYDDLHRVLAPSRLSLVKTMAGQGPLSIREVARRLERDIQAVHRDVTTLISAGIIDKQEKGILFPYDNIHFEFDVTTEKAA